jgi:hypothetical protein
LYTQIYYTQIHKKSTFITKSLFSKTNFIQKLTSILKTKELKHYKNKNLNKQLKISLKQSTQSKFKIQTFTYKQNILNIFSIKIKLD